MLSPCLLMHATDCCTLSCTASAQEVDEDASAADDVASTSGRSHTAGHQRATLCVSSQVGCIMGCTFCATGTMGLKEDLSAGEILEQLVHAQRVTPIRNVVFMVRLHCICSCAICATRTPMTVLIQTSQQYLHMCQGAFHSHQPSANKQLLDLHASMPTDVS